MLTTSREFRTFLILSCGLCMCRQGDNFEEYYIKADKALYYVKQNGKNNYRFYEELEEQ